MPLLTHAQTTQIEVINADEFIYDNTTAIEIQLLRGNVHLRQKDTEFFCDSAYMYPQTNILTAYGNIRFIQKKADGQIINATADTMLYNGNTKLGNLFGDIVLQDGETTINTRRLDYDAQKKTAYYKNTKTIGKYKTSEISSKNGYYDTNTKTFVFKEKVIITDPNYTLNADTLNFETETKKARFKGPTYIRSSGNLIYTERGSFDTNTRNADLTQNAYIITKEKQIIKADSLYYTDATEVGICRSHVLFVDTAQKTILRSNYAYIDKKEKMALLHGTPLLMNYTNTDTLYLTADTILSITNKIDSTQKIYAYKHVKAQRTNLVMQADSLFFTTQDSVFRLYNAPILWNEAYQISADSIHLHAKNKGFEKIVLYKDAFLIKQNDTLRYDQIKGRLLTAYINPDTKKIKNIDIQGNGQTIYYVMDSKNKYVGVNKVESADIKMTMNTENKPEAIKFYTKPTGKTTPIRQAPPNDFRLDGFFWAIDKQAATTKVLRRIITDFYTNGRYAWSGLGSNR
jgi:lipopolysaccharide transport protein LptA